jgi:hypothetical protein
MTLSHIRSEWHLSAKSGVIAASLAANSVLFHFRNPALKSDGITENTVKIRLKLLYVKWRTITGYTSGQELALEASQVTAFGAVPADYTGGTDLSHPSTEANQAYRYLGPDPWPTTVASSLQSGNVSIATTAGLSHTQTPTIKTHPFAWDSYRELDTGAAIPRGAFDMVWTPSLEGSLGGKGLRMDPGTGFVIRNPIALGAGGTGRMFVELVYEQEGNA